MSIVNIKDVPSSEEQDVNITFDPPSLDFQPFIKSWSPVLLQLSPHQHTLLEEWWKPGKSPFQTTYFHVLQALSNFAIDWDKLNGSLFQEVVFPFHYRLILLLCLGYLVAVNAMPAEDDEEGEEEEEEGEEGEEDEGDGEEKGSQLVSVSS